MWPLLSVWVISKHSIFKVLARDLSESLFEKETYEATRLKVQIAQNKHLIVSGGHWKNEVIEWLKSRGF